MTQEHLEAKLSPVRALKIKHNDINDPSAREIARFAKRHENMRFMLIERVKQNTSFHDKPNSD